MPARGRDRTLFKLFGLPVKANVSWLFLVALVLFSLAQFRFIPRAPSGMPWFMPWVLAVVGTIGLFASLIVHEMCHSLVARSAGIPVAGITLFIFGGVSQLEDEPPTAGSEFIMAVVGPLSSALIGAALLAGWFVSKHAGWAWGVQELLLLLAGLNFMLAVFNSLPAFPLDGGRVLRSILWGLTGDLRLATHVAANIGSLFGIGFVVLGVSMILMLHDFIYGVWFMVIGFFIRQAALGSLQMVVIRQTLEGDTIARFMTKDLVTVPAGMSLQQFVDEIGFHHRFTQYPVLDGEGRLLGMVNARAPREVHPAHWPQTTVADVMQPAEQCVRLAPDDDAMDALSALRTQDNSRAVVLADDRPVGIVSLRDLLGFLALKIDLEPRRRR